MDLKARDVLILISLASCYACHYGILSCLGLFQEVWMSNLHFSAKEVSWISGLTLSVFRIPSPFIEFLLQWFKVPSCIQLGSAGFLIGAGMMALGSATNLTCVLLASLFGLGLGSFLSLLSVYTSMYLFFKDKQIPLFMSIITSAAGLALIVIALVFDWLQRSTGWQFAFRYQSLFCMPYLFAAVILCPKLNPRLSDLDKQQSYSMTIGSVILHGSDINNEKQLFNAEQAKDRESVEKEIEEEPQVSKFSKICNSWKDVLLNRSFILLISSWMLAGGTIRACMVHEPQRIVHLGYSMKSGAESLAINGGVQFAARLTVGLLASANLISIIRLSQLANIFLALSTFISVFYTHLAVQHGYMLMLGVCGGIMDTTVVILVKECLENERDIAISVLIFVDAVSVLIATTSAGYFVDFFQNYQLVFAIYGACFVLGALLSIMMEVSIKRSNKGSFKATSLSDDLNL